MHPDFRNRGARDPSISLVDSTFGQLARQKARNKGISTRVRVRASDAERAMSLHVWITRGAGFIGPHAAGVRLAHGTRVPDFPSCLHHATREPEPRGRAA